MLDRSERIEKSEQGGCSGMAHTARGDLAVMQEVALMPHVFVKSVHTAHESPIFNRK